MKINKKQPLVTIAIPTFNRKEYLKQAIESVLEQSYKNIELVVSDNHSDDGTEELVIGYLKKHSNIRYFRQDENVGARLNWLNCVHAATGEYCLILSDDDILELDAVEKMVRAFEENVVLVIGNMRYIDTSGKPFRKRVNIPGTLTTSEFWEARLMKEYHDTPSAVMYPTRIGRAAWDKTEEAGSAMDLATDLIIANAGNVKCIEDIVVNYRIHDGNDTKNVYRCAKSHVGFYHLMEDKVPNNKCKHYLVRYCEDVISGYVYIAMRQGDLQLANKCLLLLRTLYGYSRLRGALLVGRFVVTHGWRKVWRMFVGGNCL